MQGTSILLVTLNARYPHSAFGLRYLLANLGEASVEARILEFTINQAPRAIAEVILAHEPRILGLGVYIWNARQSLELVSLLKKLRPDLLIVLGGPEVSHETEAQEICRLADLTICGEGDFVFRDLCLAYLRDGSLPQGRVVRAELPESHRIASPYSCYTDEDIRHRVIYVEASRGCPYRCEYCLSSLDKSVRGFELEAFLADMDRLIGRGARRFKFVDRTFNLSVTTSRRILEFFLERIRRLEAEPAGGGLFLHFEMVPDRLPLELRDLIRQFPPGALQFEIGIQTWSREVAARVSRRLDYEKIRENFAFLTRETSVHIHADLIAGLPGETWESFGAGFDALAELGPHEIQVGILKRLRGTPIIRHDREYGMVYDDFTPYPIVRTSTLAFSALQRLGRFSRFWDLVANSGNFGKTMGLLRELAAGRARPSLFDEMIELTDFLALRHPQDTGVALLHLVESAWLYLTVTRGVSPGRARETLVQDYAGTVKRDVPAFLRVEGVPTGKGNGPRRTGEVLPRRQLRHAQGVGTSR